MSYKRAVLDVRHSVYVSCVSGGVLVRQQDASCTYEHMHKHAHAHQILEK
jgi:hypothetical protein